MTATPPTDDAPDERSLALFQRASDPLFLLNRRRQVRFVNRAFEALAGMPAADIVGKVCSRRRGTPPLQRALSPPPEALNGRPAHARRAVPPARVGPPWWELSFLPLRADDGPFAILGRVDRVEGVPPPTNAGTRVLAESLLALRDPLAGRYDFTLFAGPSPALGRLAAQLRLAAGTCAPVLMVGPPGSGKRTAARVIHHQGVTRSRGFVAIDAAGLPQSVLGLVLFGLNGLASPERLGTLYLREPSRLPRDVQARLAEWLAERPDDGPRLVAGTIADPRAEVQAGRLTEELHAALAVLTVEVPPLRERRAELSALTATLLERARAAGLTAATALTPAAWDCLLAYDWPGNLRELDRVLADASLAAGGPVIDLPNLPGDVRRSALLARQPVFPRPKLDLRRLLEEAERRMIESALRYANGRQEEAADLLGVPRAYLWRWAKGEAAEAPKRPPRGRPGGTTA